MLSRAKLYTFKVITLTNKSCFIPTPSTFVYSKVTLKVRYCSTNSETSLIYDMSWNRTASKLILGAKQRKNHVRCDFWKWVLSSTFSFFNNCILAVATVMHRLRISAEAATILIHSFTYTLSHILNTRCIH